MHYNEPTSPRHQMIRQIWRVWCMACQKLAEPISQLLSATNKYM